MSEQEKERVTPDPVEGAEDAIERTKDDGGEDADFEGHRMVAGDEKAKDRHIAKHSDI